MSVIMLGNKGINAIAHAVSAYKRERGMIAWAMHQMPEPIASTFDVATIGQYLCQRNIDAFNQERDAHNHAPRFTLTSDDTSTVFVIAAIDAYLNQLELGDIQDDKLTYLLMQTRLYVTQTMSGYVDALNEILHD